MTQKSTGQTVTIKRPQGLSLTCIFTFIGSGLSAISSLVIFLAFKEFNQVIDKDIFPQAEQIISLALSAGRWFFLISFVLYIFSFTGALLIWNLKKTGFHLYSISQLLLLLVPLIMIEGYSLPLFNTMLTLVFITIYGLNLKLLRE